MKEKWINIEKGTPLDGLWSHEWDKHGTCAATQIAKMNNQLNYFTTGLRLFDELSVTKILQQSYIKAGMSYKLEEIHEVLNRSIGNNFAIVCEKDHVTKEQLLFEIRICLDKELKLHSCEGIVMRTNEFRNSGEIISNCKKDQEIVYPSYNFVIKKQWNRNIQEQNTENKTWMHNIVNAYKLMKLIQWFTF
jgi:ribonuclease I